MAGFIGGSAPAMVGQITQGFCLLNHGILRGWPKSDLQSLRAELDKALRDVRATVPAQDDAHESQFRNRKIGRLSSAIQVVHAAMTGRPGPG